MILTPPSALSGHYTSRRVYSKETAADEIPAAHLVERVAPQDSYNVHPAFDLHRLSAFRHRHGGSVGFHPWRLGCRDRSHCADQQSDFDHAAADLLQAADRENTRRRSSDARKLVQWRVSGSNERSDNDCRGSAILPEHLSRGKAGSGTGQEVAERP